MLLWGKAHDKEAAVLSSIPIRLGGMAAMVSGVLYVAAELLDLPDRAGWRSYYELLPGSGSLFFNALFFVGALAATLTIAVLYALRRDRYGTLGMLTSVAASVGVALMFWGELGSPVATIVGLLLGSLSVFALGLLTIGIGVWGLPWWCGVALIVWGSALLSRMLLVPVVGFSALTFLVSLGGVLAALPWIVVGFGVFRAAERRTEQPRRVR